MHLSFTASQSRCLVGITTVILGAMKTAISIPDSVFRKTERLAKRLKLSRSEFFTTAAQRLLAAFDEAEVTASYNSAFSDGEGKADTRFRREATRQTLAAVEWSE